MNQEMKVKEKNRILFVNSILMLTRLACSMWAAKLISGIVVNASAGNLKGVISNVVMICVLYLIEYIFEIIFGISKNTMLSRCINNEKLSFMKDLLETQSNKIYNAEKGQLLENLDDDIEEVVNKYDVILPNIVTGLITVMAYFIFLARENGIVVLTLAGMSMIQMLPAFIVKKYLVQSYEDCREIEGQLTDCISDAINGFELLKIFGQHGWWQDQVKKIHHKYISIGNKSSAYSYIQQALYSFNKHLLKFGTYGVMGCYALLNICSIDTAVMAIYLSDNLYAAAQNIYQAIGEKAVASKAQNRLSQWKESKKMIEKKDFVCPVTDGMNLQISHVKFTDVIRDGNCVFDTNYNYIMEGENGSGKSTLLYGVLGWRIPESGIIQIQDIGISDVPEEARKDLIWPVLQNDLNYSMTVKEFLNMFGEKIKGSFFEIATIFGLPKEIDKSLVSELSGGERKKVFLSIAFASDAPFLFLDEPTNHIDNIGYNALCKFMQERKGIIVISHDIRLRELTDKRIAVKDGLVYEKID